MFEKLAKKLKISVEDVVKMLAEQQLYDKHYKGLKKTDFNIEVDSLKFIERIAKTLKISIDAVCSIMLHNLLEKLEREKSDAKKASKKTKVRKTKRKSKRTK